nr:hypothetical protein [Akkermansiaceae bacterium]
GVYDIAHSALRDQRRAALEVPGRRRLTGVGDLCGEFLRVPSAYNQILHPRAGDADGPAPA